MQHAHAKPLNLSGKTLYTHAKLLVRVLPEPVPPLQFLFSRAEAG